MGLRQDEDYIMDALIWVDKLKTYLENGSMIKAMGSCQEIIELIEVTNSYQEWLK